MGDFEFVSDYQLKNLRSRNTSTGLGVPIIAIRRQPENRDPVEKYYTQGMSFAATLVLRFDDDSPDGGRLQIFDPRESDGLVIGDIVQPLEADVSTPLARYLSNKDISLLDTWGFIRPDRAARSFRSVHGSALRSGSHSSADGAWGLVESHDMDGNVQ